MLFASFASDRLGRVLGKHMPNYSGLRVGTLFREETPKHGCSVHKRVEALKKPTGDGCRLKATRNPSGTQAIRSHSLSSRDNSDRASEGMSLPSSVGHVRVSYYSQMEVPTYDGGLKIFVVSFA